MQEEPPPTRKKFGFVLLDDQDKPTSKVFRSKSSRGAAIKAMHFFTKSMDSTGPYQRPTATRIDCEKSFALLEPTTERILRFRGWREARPGLTPDHQPWLKNACRAEITKIHVEELNHVSDPSSQASSNE